MRTATARIQGGRRTQAQAPTMGAVRSIVVSHAALIKVGDNSQGQLHRWCDTRTTPHTRGRTRMELLDLHMICAARTARRLGHTMSDYRPGKRCREYIATCA